MRSLARLMSSAFFALSFLAATQVWAAVNPWSAAAAAPTSRENATATLLSSGKLLVVGGSANSTPLSSAALYDRANNAWTAAAPLATARQYQTATLLRSGKVLVVGGDNGSPLASVELYDPAVDAWSTVASLHHARRGHTATLLADGRVLVAGGYDGNPDYSASAEIYDPAANAWTNVAALAAARYLHAATLLPNGKVLVTGGYGAASYLGAAELYDPQNNAWSSAGAALGRDSHTATLLANGKVLVFGGNSGSGTIAYPELYDPATNSWSLGGTGPGALPGARFNHCATLLPSGRVLIAGGYAGGYLDTVALYDAAADSWIPAGHMLAGRWHHAATLLPTGEVLVSSGADSGGALASAELYDPTSASAVAATAMPTARDYAAATLLPSGKLLVTGGGGNSGDLAKADLFDPGSDAWSSAAALHNGRFQHTLTLLPSGHALAIGGFDAQAKVEDYDAATNAWTTRADLITGRSEHTATLLASGRVLVAGGLDTAVAVISKSEVYDPADDTWTAQGDMASKRYLHTATLLPSGKVFVAGGIATNPGGAIDTSEIYDPATGWSSAVSMSTSRCSHTATLLPSGKVLVVGGNGGPGFNYLASAEVYDPATNSWSAAGTLAQARSAHTATLLPSGKVLVAGGNAYTTSLQILASTEIYDPATNAWTPGPTLASAHRFHTATLLPSGLVMVAGSMDPASQALAVADLVDPGLAPDATRAPDLSAANAFLLQTSALAATANGSAHDATTGATTATGFQPTTEGGGSALSVSATNTPVLQVQRLDNGQMRFIPSDEAVDTSDTNFTGAANAFAGFPAGPVLVRAWVNGVPGAPRYSTLAVAPGKPPAPVASGGVLAATVTLTPPVDDGGAPIDSYMVTATPGGATYSCIAPCSTANFVLDPGAYTFTVAAHSAVGFGPDSAASNSVTVTQATTTISITAFNEPAAPGTNVMFSATINNAVNPTGNVYFCADASDIFTCAGGTPLCTVPAATSPATCSTNTLTPGVHDIKAYFPGDIDNSASSSRVTEYVGIAPTITSANTVTFHVGVPQSFTVTTTGTPTPTLTAGSITFPSGVTYVDNSDGTATFSGTPASGSVGSYTVTLHAQDNIPPDAVQTLTLIVAKSAQTLQFAPQVPASRAFVLDDTFAISPLATSAVPNSANNITYSSATPAVCSVAATTVTMLAAGTCTIAADQAGNADFDAAVTVSQNVAIGVAAQAITNFIATPANPTFTPGGSFTVSATGGASGNAVVFSIAAASASICVAGGSNGATISMLGAGSCVVHADQAGDANYAAAAQATLAVAIARKTTTVALSASANPVAGGTPVVLTATVAGDPPSGTVDFCDGAATASAGCAGGTAVCAARPLAPGAIDASATCSVVLASGTHTLTAYYAGDPNFAPVATAQALSLVVNAAAVPTAPVPAPVLDPRSLLLLTLFFGAIGACGARIRARRLRADLDGALVVRAD